MKPLDKSTLRLTALALMLSASYSLLSPARAQQQNLRGHVTAQQPLPAKITTETPISTLTQFENILLPRKLDEEEMKVIAARISTENGLSAGSAARFLANAQSNDTSQRLSPVLARFEREIEHPVSEFMPSFLGASLSGRACVLVQFLLAFSSIEGPEVRIALEKDRAATASPLLHQWLTVALGYTGDETVADSLKAALDEKKDGSTKALILRAYARSASEKAIPVLEGHLEDKTVTNEGCFGPYYGLQMAARDELGRLRPTPQPPKS